jgi:XTP/dITP diphosphohydrolase
VRAKLASQNSNKLAELRAALPNWEIDPIAADEWPAEDGVTYEDNARVKARFGRALAGPDEWALGEDSGIECTALDGAPGVHSARWAPSGDQADALLERLAAEDDRRARMVTALVAISPEGQELIGTGVLEGTIASARRGESGFGYDPIFVPRGYAKTCAELGEDWKSHHSHRALAARALAAAIGR